MLNNKKHFDILTPMSDFHRVSRRVAEVDDFETEIGYWVKVTKDGAVNHFDGDGAANTDKGVSVVCLSSSKRATNGLSLYETNDVKVGSVTCINTPGIRISAGEDYFATGIDTAATDALWVPEDGASYNVGVMLGVMTDIDNAGKLEMVGVGEFGNAIITGIDHEARIIEYMIILDRPNA